MAHFRGTIKGIRDSEVSRLGNQNSGLIVTANGWNFGVRVELNHNEEKDSDEATIYLTGGSKAITGELKLGTYSQESIIKLFKR